MNYELLAHELKNDEYDGKSAAECAALLNAPGVVDYVPVSSVDVATHLMETPCQAVAPLSLYNCLSLTYRNPAFPPQVQAIAENIIDLATGVDRPLSLRGNGGYEQAFGILVQAGRYTQAEVDGILDLGKRTISRAEDVLGGPVTETDVQIAWNQEEIEETELRRSQVNSSYGATLALVQERLNALGEGQVLQALPKSECVDRFAQTMESED